MAAFRGSDQILERNRRFIPGGMSSINRLTDPNIAFVRGEGSRIWDADGNEYIDYHGAFAPQFPRLSFGGDRRGGFPHSGRRY